MKAVAIALLLTGCASEPKTHCIGGFAHSYAAASGFKQVWSEMWVGVPCP